MLRESILRPGRARFSKPSVLFFLALLLSISISYAAISDGIVAYYNMDYDISDTTGSGHDWVAYSFPPTTQDGIVNNSQWCNGVLAGECFYQASSEWVSNLQDLSIALWFMPNGSYSAQNQNGLFATSKSSVNESISLYFDDVNNKIFFDLDDDTNQCRALISLTITQEAWHFVAAVYNTSENEISLYLDGSLIDTASCNYNLSTIVYSVALGSSNNQDFSWDGNTDEYGIWNRSLTDVEISQLYSCGNGTTYPDFLDNCPVNCTPNWTCSGYGSCNSSDLRLCNQTTDLNACGDVYAGDYSEFAPQVCDFCTPAWSCSAFGMCNISGNMSCLNVTDVNVCSEPFNGTLSDYDSNCTFTGISLPISIASNLSNSTINKTNVDFCFSCNSTDAKLAIMQVYRNSILANGYSITTNLTQCSVLDISALYTDVRLRCYATANVSEYDELKYIITNGLYAVNATTGTNIFVNEANMTDELMLGILSALFITLFIIGMTMQLNIFVFISGIGFLFIGFNYLDIFAFKLLFGAIGVMFVMVWAFVGLRPRDDSR